MKKYILLVIFLCLSQFLSAQKEANNWFFCHGAGITFNTPDGHPISVNGGKANGFWPGITQSDSNGKLLFYTDCQYIRNRKHEIIKNGVDFLLRPFYYSGISCVRKPGSDSLYYIFHYIYIQNHLILVYSLIDMFLDNGLGEIIEKNVPIHENCYNVHTLVRNSNGRDVWIVVADKQTSTLVSYLISDSGISKAPVQACTITFSTYPPNSFIATSDGKKLYYFATFNFNGEIYAGMLFDFDNSSGKTTSNHPIIEPNGQDGGLETPRFSPDGSKLWGGEGGFWNLTSTLGMKLLKGTKGFTF